MRSNFIKPDEIFDLSGQYDNFNNGITDIDLDKLSEEGWMGPFKLLSANGVDMAINSYYTNRGMFTPKRSLQNNSSLYNSTDSIWVKSMHIHLPIFAEIASNAILAGKIAAVLGSDIVAWGVSVIERAPGQVHRWHGDVEHFYWEGVSAFIGLSNVSNCSSLNIITRSHKFGFLPQTFGSLSDREILKLSRKFDTKATIKSVPLKNGEFFIFNGRLWHGSHNKSKKNRLAVLAQYTSSSAEVRIPLTYDEPIIWDSYRPTSLAVKTMQTGG